MSIEQAKAFLDGCNDRHHHAGYGGAEPVTLDDIMGVLIGVGYAIVAVAEQLESGK